MQEPVADASPPRVGRWTGDDRRDLVHVIATIVLFTVLFRLMTAGAQLRPADGTKDVLLLAAVRSNWIESIAVFVVVMGCAVYGGRRTLDGWSAMDHGTVWRWLAIPWIVTVAWYGAMYDYNYLLAQWHTFDRVLIIVLAFAAIVHPLFLVPFAFQVSAVASQVTLPFGGTTTLGSEHLALVAIVVVATAFLVAMTTDRHDTSPALLVLGMAVAAHFFVPGRSKVAIDWLTNTELHNFAFSSFTTGWRGDGDGTWADTVASVMRTLRWPLLIGTLIAEVGAAIAVFNRRLLRWWLPLWIAMHASVFVVSGYWLFEWVIVELGLLIVLWRGDLVDWVSRNDTLARGALAVVVVVAFGSSVFSPPKLAWLDAPISYGYEVEATGESGEVYHVPLDEFGLLLQDLAFGFASFTARPHAVGGYGATQGVDYYGRLQRIDDFDELRALEASFEPIPEERRRTSEEVLTNWVDRVNQAGAGPWFLITPPARYWVDRPDPTYDYSEPLRSLTVVLVRSIHDDGGQRFDRETVLRVDVGGNGRAVVTERVQADDTGG